MKRQKMKILLGESIIMNVTKKSALFAGVAIGLLSTGALVSANDVSCASCSAYDPQIQALSNEISSLAQTISNLRAQVTSIQSKIANTQELLAAKQAEEAELLSQIASLEAQKSAKESELATLNQQKSALIQEQENLAKQEAEKQATATETSEAIKQKENDLAAANDAITKNEATITDLGNQLDTAISSKDQAEQEVADAEQKSADIKAKNDAEIANKEQEVANLEKQINENQAIIDRAKAEEDQTKKQVIGRDNYEDITNGNYTVGRDVHWVTESIIDPTKPDYSNNDYTHKILGSEGDITKIIEMYKNWLGVERLVYKRNDGDASVYVDENGTEYTITPPQNGFSDNSGISLIMHWADDMAVDKTDGSATVIPGREGKTFYFRPAVAFNEAMKDVVITYDLSDKNYDLDLTTFTNQSGQTKNGKVLFNLFESLPDDRYTNPISNVVPEWDPITRILTIRLGDVPAESHFMFTIKGRFHDGYDFKSGSTATLRSDMYGTYVSDISGVRKIIYTLETENADLNNQKSTIATEIDRLKAEIQASIDVVTTAKNKLSQTIEVINQVTSAKQAAEDKKPALEADRDRLEKELADLKNQLADLTTALNLISSKKAELTKEIEELDKTIDSLTTDLEALAKQISDTREQLVKVGSASDEAKEQLAKLEAELKAIQTTIDQQLLLNKAKDAEYQQLLKLKEDCEALCRRMHHIIYDFQSATSGQSLPQEVLALMPNSSETVIDGMVVTAKLPTSTSITVSTGTWVFVGYDATNKTVNGSDIQFVGTWKFIAKPVANTTSLTVAKNKAGQTSQLSTANSQRKLPNTGSQSDGIYSLTGILLTLSLAFLIPKSKKTRH